MTKASQNQKLDILVIVLSLAILALGTPALAAIKTKKIKAKAAPITKPVLINVSSIQQIDALNEKNTGGPDESHRNTAESSIFAKKAVNYDKFLASSPAPKPTQVPALAEPAMTSTKKSQEILPKPQEKVWNISLGANHFVPQRADRKQFTVSTIEGGYTLSKYMETSWQISAGMDYAHVWSKYDDPGNSQIDEIRFGLSRAQKIGSYGLSTGAEVLVPANEFDAKAGFNGALSLVVGGAVELGMVKIGGSVKPTFFSYKFDTPEVASTRFNKRSSVEGNLIFALKFNDRISWGNLARLTEGWNMAGTQTQTYLLSTGLNFKVSDQIELSAGILSKDRVITTNEAFSENVNTIRVGMEIGI